MTASERSLGIQWVVANIVGWLIGFALCEAIQSFISTVLVDGLVIGSAVGIAQWLVLRRWMSPVGWWVLLSIIGFGVGKALAEAILPSASTLPWYAATGAIIGASVGVAQWPVLRQHVSSAAWWVPATIVAWIGGWSAIGVAEHAVDWPTLTTYAVGGVGAALAGTVTAIVLIWLRRIPRVSAESRALARPCQVLTTATERQAKARRPSRCRDEYPGDPRAEALIEATTARVAAAMSLPRSLLIGRRVLAAISEERRFTSELDGVVRRFR